ncbi:transcription factor 19-like [Bombina bombina]|uniref:transcription factor 19-like n=1 Tax=Bombina bombina TaxID=8345 RepID=UPI00235ADCC6|nr:transcription factor 19-like [Bombina bombina]XP_053545154.1 transcription factor 19-like [Bombina bombina]
MVGSEVSLSQVQPCFQLLRMGADPGPSPVSSNGGAPYLDLYTFLPDLPRCTYKLGSHPELCDVPLPGKPRVHAEIHAERETSGHGDWKVTLQSCTNCGIYVNDTHLARGERFELTDGDLLRFQEKVSSHPTPDIYFMFQRVSVRPLDFSAITSPRARKVLPGFTPVVGSQRLKGGLGASPHYTTGATVILNSIGSISKMMREKMHSRLVVGGAVEMLKPSTPDLPLPSRTGQERRSSRRKAQHRVLCELEEEEHDDEGVDKDESVGKRKRKRGRRKEEERMMQQGESGRKPRGRPRKHPVVPLVVSQTVSSAEPCASRSCCLPQEDTVSWVQCDHCDSWYHVVCIGRSLTSLQNTDFHCGCT